MEESSSAAAFLLLLCLLLAFASKARAQESQISTLSQASLEELMNVRVTSASRRDQPESKVAAAIFVITPDDIRRSGATNLPDLLRMVPGLDVAQIDANAWAVSARGFNGELANKMLVMIDGRTVYDPAFSGVFWDAQDVVLQDIERIEVIRGPGATIWGSNAVNGVINIITKSAADTQGGLIAAGGGSVEQGFGTIQYGGKIGQRAAFRVFEKYFNEAGFRFPDGEEARDDWHMNHGGFRTDWNITGQDLLTVEGDIFGSEKGQPIPPGPDLLPPYSTPAFTSLDEASGGDALARWTHTVQSGSRFSLQAYFDRLNWQFGASFYTRNTFDLDFAHQFTWGSRNAVVWGLDYRYNADHVHADEAFSFTPAIFSDSLESGFVQDEFTLVPGKLWLTAGTKIEHNYFTGFETEPSVRLLWQPAERDVLWAAFSNANRIPSQEDADVRSNGASFLLPGGTVALVSLFGERGLPSESLRAYELGYRFYASSELALDIATFYNVYHHLRTIEQAPSFVEASPPPPHLVMASQYGDKASGRTYGAEASLTWRPRTYWTLLGGYSWFVPSMTLAPNSTDTTTIPDTVGSAPRNQFQIRSELALPRNFSLDNSLYWAGGLATGPIPAYTRFDTRIAWKLGERTQLSLVGQNLLEPRHLEFSSIHQAFQTTEPRRSVFGEIVWRF